MSKASIHFTGKSGERSRYVHHRLASPEFLTLDGLIEYRITSDLVKVGLYFVGLDQDKPGSICHIL
jgi:hypothetical protein